MVPFHKALAPDTPRTRTELVLPEFEPPSSKKRKWEEEEPFSQEYFFEDLTNNNKSESKKPLFELELHLDSPFSADKLRQFLTIQSGQIHVCNTRVNKTTTITATKAEDSRRNNPEPTQPPHHMSLDLDLNLTCESLKKRDDEDHTHNVNLTKLNSGSVERKKDSDDGDNHRLIRSPSWLSSEGDHKEMVATVCMRCHMLVMLCKSSPSCPNCKFMHPPDQNPSNFLKKRCTLFC